MTHEIHIYILKMEAMLLDENYYTGSHKGYMNIRFELQYKAVAEFKWNFYFSVYKQLHVNCVMAAGFKGK